MVANSVEADFANRSIFCCECITKGKVGCPVAWTHGHILNQGPDESLAARNTLVEFYPDSFWVSLAIDVNRERTGLSGASRLRSSESCNRDVMGFDMNNLGC